MEVGFQSPQKWNRKWTTHIGQLDSTAYKEYKYNILGTFSIEERFHMFSTIMYSFAFPANILLNIGL